MSNDFSPAPDIHIYRLKRRTIAGSLFSLFFLMAVIGIPLIALMLLVASNPQSEKSLDSAPIVFICLLSPFILLMAFSIISTTINILLSLFSYIQISPDGIEHKYSPYRHIRCKWSDIDILGKYLFYRDVLYLNSFEVLGMSLSLKSPFRFLHPKQEFIMLTGYNGWPDGQLANDLRQYAPRLFENQPILPQETPPENKEVQKDVQARETPAMSHEVRLLAAISHASILFHGVGLFVPIGVYLTQKNKSSYLSFQSLQAIIWQIVSMGFSLFMSVCLAGLVIIPVFWNAMSQNEEIMGFSVWLLLAAIIGVFMVTIGSLVFVTYGIIGAVMTYQGNDFRYVFIGNRIDKSKGVQPTNRA